MNSFCQNFGRFQTSHPQMKKAIEEATNLAPTLKPILIVGPRSSGKKELALFIHENSSRSKHQIQKWSKDIDISKDDTILVDHWDRFAFEDRQKIKLQLSHIKARWIFISESIDAELKKLNFSVILLPNFKDRVEDHLFIAKDLFASFSLIKNKEVQFNEDVQFKILNTNWGTSYSDFEAYIEKFFIDGEIRPGMTLLEMERKLILQTLQMTKQNRTKAAEILGISIRTLRNKLTEYRQEGVFHE